MKVVRGDHKKHTGLSLLLAVLGLSFVHNYLFFGNDIGLNYFVFYILIAIFVLAVVRLRTGVLRPMTIVLATLGGIFAGFSFVHASELLIFFNILASLLLLGAIVVQTIPGGLRQMSAIRLGLEYIIMPIYMLVALFQHKLLDRNSVPKVRVPKSSAAVWRGVLITLPVMAVFLALFAAADSVFANLLSFDLPNISINVEFASRLIVLAFMFIALLGVTKHLYLTKEENVISGELQKMKPAPTEVKILLTTLNIIFLVFVVIQIVYLFGGRQVVIDQGLTLAEYARKGFFELLFVALLAHIVIAVSDHFVKREGRDVRAKILQLALTAQVFVVIASALRRMKLYQDEYGFTTSRFYAYVIMFCIAAAFIALAWKIARNRPSSWLMPYYGAIFLSSILVLNYVVPDRFVAQQNIDRALQGKKFDFSYIYSLSDDAVEEKFNASEFSGLGQLDPYPCYSGYKNDWRSYNIARNHAQDVRNQTVCKDIE